MSNEIINSDVTVNMIPKIAVFGVGGAGINAVNRFLNKEKIVFSDETVIGALAKYISTENDKFDPMNANFGILPSLESKIKDKKLKYEKMADRSLKIIKELSLN